MSIISDFIEKNDLNDLETKFDWHNGMLTSVKDNLISRDVVVDAFAKAFTA